MFGLHRILKTLNRAMLFGMVHALRMRRFCFWENVAHVMAVGIGGTAGLNPSHELNGI